MIYSWTASNMNAYVRHCSPHATRLRVLLRVFLLRTFIVQLYRTARAEDAQSLYAWCSLVAGARVYPTTNFKQGLQLSLHPSKKVATSFPAKVEFDETRTRPLAIALFQRP